MRVKGVLHGAGCNQRGRCGLFFLLLILGAFGIGAGAPSALALSPSVSTSSATSIAETGATLDGLVNPNSLATKAYFEYGTTTSYGSKTSEASVGSGSTTVELSQGISGLTANTLYHYRIVATNADGASQGTDKTFTTAGPPSVITESGVPDNTTGEAATLNAWVDPNGQSTTYQFEYGTKSGTYTTTVPIPAESAGSSFEGKAVNYKITGLTRGTTYYFRVTATNAGGKVNGAEKSFTTPNKPTIVTEEAVEVGPTSATLRGVINKGGLTTYYWFEYGTTESYGTKIPLTPAEFKGFFAKETPSGLKSNTEYHFRLVAENALGTTYGWNESFTTEPLVTLFAGGKQLAAEAPIELFSSNMTFNVLNPHSCEETIFSGKVTRNPEPTHNVSTSKMQNSGGARCPFGMYTIAYVIPYTAETTVEYVNEWFEGDVVFTKFPFTQKIFSGSTEVASCSYNMPIVGVFNVSEAPLELTLGGYTEPVSVKSPCPGKEYFEGDFTVKSNGETVEVGL